MTPALDMALDLFLSAMLVGGGIFALVGSYGLLRLPRPMQRLHAPTKATTIGVGAALLVSALDLLDQGLAGFRRQLQLLHDLPDPRTTPTIGPMSRPDSLRSNAGA